MPPLPMDARRNPSPPCLRLPEEEVRRLLLVRAFEEAGGEDGRLSRRQRERASLAARLEAEGDEQRFLVARARLLSQDLAASEPAAEQMAMGASFAPPAALVAVPAFLAGLLANALGSLRHINVLAFPLLGLILWNLAIYALLAWRGLRRGADAKRPPREPASSPWTRWAARRAWIRGPKAAELAPVVERFAVLWKRAAAPLLSARLRSALHLGALAAAAGIVAGMYLRGLAFEYRVTWESTFLDAPAAEALLRIALAPALWVTGQELPALETLRAPADAEAAPWIHLYALTALFFIGIPRIALYVLERRRVRVFAGGLPLDLADGYFRRLLAPARGTSLRALVVPYSFQPDPRALERLRALLHDAFGARAQIESAPPVEYGAEAERTPMPAHEEGGRSLLVALLPLAQPPEVEVHGRWLEELRAGARAALLVVLDSSAYARRLEDLREGPQRLDERRRAWDRVVREAGLPSVHVDLEGSAPGDGAQRLIEGLWPTGALDEARP